jgi:hypothetical protein
VSIVLQNGYSHTEFSDDIQTLDTQITQLVSELGVFRGVAASRDQHKAQLIPLIKRYRAAIVASLPDTEWARTLPKTPQYASTPDKFLGAFREMKNHWTRLNALAPGTIPGFTTPFVLPVVGTTLAQFTAILGQLEAIYLQLGQVESTVDSLRAGRDNLLPGLKERMKQYRSALPVVLGTTHPSVKNAPRLTPAQASPLPPLNATIHWDAATKKAMVHFNRLPESAKIARYELRYYPGQRYVARNEQTVEQATASASTFITDVGLQFPGAIASYRVYAVTDNGRETGSTALMMMAPDEE